MSFFLVQFLSFFTLNTLSFAQSGNETPILSASVIQSKECQSFLTRVSQIPASLRRVSKLIDREFDWQVLDAAFTAFEGFHDGKGADEAFFRQRPWEKVNLKEIRPDQIVGISVADFVGALYYAMEIEDPILGYSFASGQGFRYLLPRVGRFMGRNDEQVSAVMKGTSPDTKPRDWCVSPWCSEEQRHGNYWARLIESLTGVTPGRDNPVVPDRRPPDEVGATFHHYSRQSTEWSATSAYLFLAAHSTGELQRAIMNVVRDEIKHLVLISAADVYLFGRNPNTRMINMVKKSLAELRSHSKERSTGGSISKNPQILAEVLRIHYLVELKMRAYLAQLPYSTLRVVFDAPSKLPELPIGDLTSEDKERIYKMTSDGGVIRSLLVRWPIDQASSEIRKYVSAHINQALVDRIIRSLFNDFKGAEVPGSPGAKQMRLQIERMNLIPYSGINSASGSNRGLEFKTWGPNGPEVVILRDILLDRLREYQIRNNVFIRTGRPIPESFNQTL